MSTTLDARNDIMYEHLLRQQFKYGAYVIYDGDRFHNLICGQGYTKPKRPKVMKACLKYAGAIEKRFEEYHPQG